MKNVYRELQAIMVNQIVNLKPRLNKLLKDCNEVVIGKINELKNLIMQMLLKNLKCPLVDYNNKLALVKLEKVYFTKVYKL